MALPVTGERDGPAKFMTPNQRATVRRGAIAVAALYPVTLLVLIAAFRFVGERAWATTVALYLPRIGFALPLPVLLLALWTTGARRGLRMLLLLGTSLPLLLVIGGFVMPWPVRANPDAPVMRVMSYNVNSEAGGADAIVAEVDRYSPDIVFLVEHGASDAMVSLLQARYATVRAMGQFVIATRFPVTSAVDPDKLHYAGSRRSPRWIEAAIDTPLGPIMFLVVHPISPRDGLVAAWAGGLRHKIGTALGLARGTDEIVDYNSGLREMQVAGFTASAQTKSGPVVIAGDTNLPGLSYLLHRYLSEYQDGFTRSGWGFGYTFPVGKHRPWMRIDRILASDELRFVRFQVGTSASSDHRCVVADLQRAP